MSKELDIISLVAQTTGQAEALRDDVFWEAETRRIYTTDMLVEGQHFSLDYFSPEDLGWKAAAVNISDIAGTGGTLKYLLISLGLPKTFDLAWVQQFYQGLSLACQEFGGCIVGGDTVGSDRLTINVTAIGECSPMQHPGHRFNAQEDDYIIATGFHGLSAIGLQALQSGVDNYPVSKAAHRRPWPRIAAGLLLSERFDRYALMDSSDGLADALLKIALASNKTLCVNALEIPMHPEVTAYSQAHQLNPWQAILYGGEDFELVATVPWLDAEILQAFHVIGRVESAEGGNAPSAWLIDAETGQRQPLTLEKTFQHFATTASPAP